MNLPREYPVGRILVALERDNLLPAIVFRTSRRQCDSDVTSLAGVRRTLLTPEARSSLHREVEKAIDQYSLPRDVILEHPQLDALLTTAVGAHHAGQLLAWRLLLEELMSRGVLRLLIATGTVAAGVDFPARSVIITAHSKRGSEGFRVLTASELQQMSGRAGRRGKDSVGFCLVAPGPYSDARVIHDVSQRPPEPLRSAYFASPSTVLNLLKFRNVDDLKFTVSRSLAAFLDKKSATIIETEAKREEEDLSNQSNIGEESLKKAAKRIRRKFTEATFVRQRQEKVLERALEGLEVLGHIEGGSLTQKGYWAAELCTTLVLELAEAIEEGLFEDITGLELVGLVGSIAGDPHRAYFGLKQNPIKKDYFHRLEAILLRVKRAYDNPPASEIAVVPNAALTVMTWYEAESWRDFSGLLRLSGVAEGDVARLVTQTADHLNQLSKLRESHPELARLAFDSRKQILKPPLSESSIEEFDAEL